MTLNPDQFAETVRQRHAANTPFNADEVEAMSDDQYHVVLNDVAAMQRGGPEDAMLHAQDTFGGGLYTYALEHIGDLTNRMNQPSSTRFAGTSGYSSENVGNKAATQHANLTYGYGFDREVGEQMERNKGLWEREGKPIPSDADFYNARRDYTLGHHSLPVYNEAGYHAKAAAVHIGLQNTDKAAQHLQTLNEMTEDNDRYQQAMSREGAVSWLRSQEPGAGPR
jgi:hypothetical protein